MNGWPSFGGASEGALRFLKLFSLYERSQTEEMIFAVAEESQTSVDDSFSGLGVSSCSS